jgi:hypothetical protein
MNIRLLGPTNAQTQTMTFNGRTYSAAAGQPLDVPDFDAGNLEAAGWIRVAMSGPSSGRPTNTVGTATAKDANGHWVPGALPQTILYPGVNFFDTTLGYVIMWDGATWRNPSTGNSV